ncbi:hypothetical protein [Bisbaumannia pacifica]|uniref:Uncharacterized protein n=2 Tax=Bisbaumannia pacifica TaxID=77098 RepID=A0A510X6S8_9GAMM|nr:hypothetical protein [Halomonas pacifica]MBH8578951.1 hypothetical protein [Halomonas pacifica]GEK47138.1 hypothetical protein HPA02_14210 [Halomonas pacifica]
MKLCLDRHSSTPIVQQLVDGIRDWIERHGAADGRRLPSIRRLSPGDVFFPQGAASPWLRLNVAYTNDPRAIRFLTDPTSACLD